MGEQPSNSPCRQSDTRSAKSLEVVLEAVIRKLLTEEDIDESKLPADDDLPASELKAVVSVSHFILNNTAKFDADAKVMATETQQLGLKKNHSELFAKVYAANKKALRDKFKADGFKIAALRETDWRLDLLLDSSTSKVCDTIAPSVHMRLGIAEDGGDKVTSTVAFEVNADKFRVLHSELAAARQMMETL